MTTTATVPWRSDLNDEQWAVVSSDPGPILVIAGAGSGKTRALTYRVAWLLHQGVPPSDVLLMTFTNRAAREMLARVESLLGPAAAGVRGGTFHHMGNWVLRRFGRRIDLDPGFTILDRDDSEKLFDACVRERAGGTRDELPKAGVLFAMLSYCRNVGENPERALPRRWPKLDEWLPRILGVFDLYEERKRLQACVDFDDLLALWKDLLVKRPEVRGELAASFPHVLVDEYQDTNPVQAEIVDLLAEPSRRLMVVGDDAQSIYGFRGARIGNILTFPDRYPGCRVLRLETNYRSTPAILAVANAAIAANRGQFPKTLRAARTGGRRPLLVEAADVGAQAEVVARDVERLLGEGFPPAEIAVLYRSHWNSLELQVELTRRRIPYQVRSGMRFFDQAHVKDVVAYLRVLANARDLVSWARLFGLCDGVGDVTAGRLVDELTAATDPMAAFVDGPRSTKVARRGAASLADLAGLLRGLRSSHDGPEELIARVVRDGYRDRLHDAYENAEEREEDLAQLAVFASKYESLSSFLDELALLTSSEDDPAAAPEERPVVLSTVHQAKGLEWRAVFIVWLADGKFPHARSLDEPAEEEEERRLFYVAVTRAKERLTLLYPRVAREARGYNAYQDPSRFLRDLDRGSVETVVFDPAPEPFDPGYSDDLS